MPSASGTSFGTSGFWNAPGGKIDDGAILVVAKDERALRIEPHTNTVTAEVPIGYPVALTAGKQAVWVSDSRGQVWRINPDTGTVTQTTPVGRGLVGLCATDGAQALRDEVLGNFGSHCATLGARAVRALVQSTGCRTPVVSFARIL